MKKADAMEALYFVGEYGEVGHEEKAAGRTKGRAWPVFSTYAPENPEQKHTNAWFVVKADAVEWAKFKNTSHD